MRLVWNDNALDDLERIRDYIVEDNPSAAVRVILRLRDELERLTTFPNMGRAGRVAETRELIYPRLPYVAVYRVDGDTVEILNIIHTAREYPPKS